MGLHRSCDDLPRDGTLDAGERPRRLFYRTRLARLTEALKYAVYGCGARFVLCVQIVLDGPHRCRGRGLRIDGALNDRFAAPVSGAYDSRVSLIGLQDVDVALPVQLIEPGVELLARLWHQQLGALRADVVQNFAIRGRERGEVVVRGVVK